MNFWIAMGIALGAIGLDYWTRALENRWAAQRIARWEAFKAGQERRSQ